MSSLLAVAEGDGLCAERSGSRANVWMAHAAAGMQAQRTKRTAGRRTQGGRGPQRQGQVDAVLEQGAAEGEDGDGRVGGLVQSEELEIVGHLLGRHQRLQRLHARTHARTQQIGAGREGWAGARGRAAAVGTRRKTCRAWIAATAAAALCMGRAPLTARLRRPTSCRVPAAIRLSSSSTCRGSREEGGRHTRRGGKTGEARLGKGAPGAAKHSDSSGEGAEQPGTHAATYLRVGRQLQQPADQALGVLVAARPPGAGIQSAHRQRQRQASRRQRRQRRRQRPAQQGQLLRFRLSSGGKRGGGGGGASGGGGGVARFGHQVQTEGAHSRLGSTQVHPATQLNREAAALVWGGGTGRRSLWA